ncbi:phage holin family protein [Streptomyces gibsoniae]|uniref:Phage holin family protein n=1 Tax=Streptomyces gibsoniae TaxID=3075529 RepID=A0ABU2TZ45_9ACTN|nr:phage holin family protein [Streptomyces sp. DSM 41699]MDT0466233.1 phage holin family protein [Streptomyces sp. DSM 41699]
MRSETEAEAAAMHVQGGDSSEGRPTVGDAAARLAQDTAQLVRHEILAVQSELRAALRRIGAGGAMLGAAGGFGVLALWSAHETALRALESKLPGPRAPALLGCAYAAGAVALGAAARDRVRTGVQVSAEAFDEEDRSVADGPGISGRDGGPG